jgi:outer membrane protein assembly factor BamB
MAVASLLLFSGRAFSVLAFSSHPARASGGGGFNVPGNILISDQFNNRALEVNSNKQIVWSFGSNNPSLCNPGPGTIIGLNDAERLGDGFTLLAGTGIPGGGADPLLPAGCVDNRVIVVDQGGTILWQYGQAGVTGSGPNQLNVPVFALQLPNHNIAIVDQSNERVIVVDKNTKKIVWHYGCPTCNLLNNPNSVELLPNGHFLIADENNNRVIEVNLDHQIVWQYKDHLNLAAFASRLPNGNTLITDSGHSRIVEINPSKQVVFQYFTNTQPGSNAAPLPTNAVQLADGDISIADQFNNRAIIIDPNKTIEFQYGMLNVVGNGPDQLDAPYTAYVIGDYTGQTPPPGQF